MVNRLSFTLLTDGSSDRALLPIVERALKRECRDRLILGAWADLSKLRNPPKELHLRILKAVDLYPCQILFIHRDAEGESFETRYSQIIAAVETAKTENFAVPSVCVIPVRMTEAWLLIDEKAIRKAAGNPNCTTVLRLPLLAELEAINDPKKLLHDLLKTASGLRGRQLKTFDPRRACLRIAEFNEDFTPLIGLPAFAHFLGDVKNVCKMLKATAISKSSVDNRCSPIPSYDAETK